MVWFLVVYEHGARVVVVVSRLEAAARATRHILEAIDAHDNDTRSTRHPVPGISAIAVAMARPLPRQSVVN